MPDWRDNAPAPTAIAPSRPVQFTFQTIRRIPRLSPRHRFTVAPFPQDFFRSRRFDDARVHCGPGVKTCPTFSKGAGERAPSDLPTAIVSSSTWTTLGHDKHVAGQTKA
jgi:hypothetical protein